MDILKFRDKLNRYLKGRTNETENALIEAWYRSYDANEINLDKEERKQIGERIRQGIDARIRKPKIYQLPLFKVAACLLVLLGASLFFLRMLRKPAGSPALYTIHTKQGELKQLMLSDSSVVWVNALSTIRFPAAFTGKLRELELIEGEVFFQIKHNDHQPFIVHAGQLDVQVLGTSFNIKAYSKLNTINVAVATGKVAVTKGKFKLATLLPGKAINYNIKTQNFQLNAVNPNDVQGWKSGNTYLKQASFEELAVIIQNLFRLSLKAGNKRVNNYRFSLHIQHNEPSEKVLQIISQIHGTHFKKEGNEVVIY